MSEIISAFTLIPGAFWSYHELAHHKKAVFVKDVFSQEGRLLSSCSRGKGIATSLVTFRVHENTFQFPYSATLYRYAHPFQQMECTISPIGSKKLRAIIMVIF